MAQSYVFRIFSMSVQPMSLSTPVTGVKLQSARTRVSPCGPLNKITKSISSTNSELITSTTKYKDELLWFIIVDLFNVCSCAVMG